MEVLRVSKGCSCEMCLQRFAGNSQLGGHGEAIHGIEHYHCGLCEFGADSNVELGSHMGAVHRPATPYKLSILPAGNAL